MCGITGAVWNRADLAVDDHVIAAMTEAIRHRGPNDAGIQRESIRRDPAGEVPGFAFGFRRLSIIDLAGAHQPMCNEDGTIWMVFNGEIYNYLDLRRRLEGGGHRFATSGDGETILHLYEELGTDCFSHFNGMFAIALWDSNQRRLILARDRMGQKPLYYAKQEGRIAFGSELKCFTSIPGLPRQIDPAAIDAYLTYQYIPHPRTIWKNIHKLPPAHYAVYQHGELTIKPYWICDYTVEQSYTRQSACERLQELLQDSVRLRLQADVPLGTFLSGGIDSSLITAIAQGMRNEPVRTFSIGFSVKDFDETHYAQMVADHLHTDHQRFEVTPDAVSIIDSLVWHFDEPFGDSSAVPTWYLSELTKREVTVALSGDGGDELFAGYERYRALWLSEQLGWVFPRQWMRSSSWLQRLPDSSRQRSFWRRMKRFLGAVSEPTARRFMNWLQIFPEHLRAEMYTDSMVASLEPDWDPFEFYHAAWQRSGDRDVVSKASLGDLQTYLPCDLMTKVDIASMAHGLEVRQPMLDYRVVEFAASLPVSLKFRGRRGKLILKDAFRGSIPEAIWSRPKMGFGVPIADWFRGPLRGMTEEMLLASDARSGQYVRREVVERMVRDHESGRVNHCYRLWNLLVLEKWLRRWI